MKHINLFASSVAAAALIVCAMALAPTTIGLQGPHPSVPNTAHSWVGNALPTAQAGFARIDGPGI